MDKNNIDTPAHEGHPWLCAACEDVRLGYDDFIKAGADENRLHFIKDDAGHFMRVEVSG